MNYTNRTIERDIDAIILDVEDKPLTYRDEISKLSQKFEKEVKTYFDFLKSYRTKKNKIEHGSFKASLNALKAIKSIVVKQHLSDLLPRRSKQESERTFKSNISHYSNRHTGTTRYSSLVLNQNQRFLNKL